jgi:hypothetical protein
MAMKKEILTFTVKQPKQRHHMMLFQTGTPFKQKVVQDKTLYKRKPKHPKNSDL